MPAVSASVPEEMKHASEILDLEPESVRRDLATSRHSWLRLTADHRGSAGRMKNGASPERAKLVRREGIEPST
jgi:hypothetical protein